MKWYGYVIAALVVGWFVLPNTVRPLVGKVKSVLGFNGGS